MRRVALAVCVLALLVLSVAPIARTVVESFLERPGDGEAAQFTLRWYDEAFVSGSPRPPSLGPSAATDPATRAVAARWRYLGNSVLIAGVAALLAVLVGVPYSLLVSRTDVPFRRLFGTAYVAPMLLPPLLVAMAWTFLTESRPAPLPPGATAPLPPAPGNPLWGGAVAVLRAGSMFALCYFPLVVLFARRALARVPASLEESARLAAGPMAALRRVTLPLAAPGILAGALFVFLFALNDFALVDFLNWVRPTADQIGVYPFEAFTAWSRKQGPSVATALGAPLALLGIVLLLVIQRVVGRRLRASVTGEFRDPSPWPLGRWKWVAVAGAAAVLAVAAAIPIGGLIAKSGGVDAYRRIWAVVAGPASSTNDVRWSVALAVGAGLVSLPLAFVLGHHAARTRRLWPLGLSLLPLALPPIFLGIGYLRLLSIPELTFPVPGAPGGRNPFLDSEGPRLGALFLLVAKYLPFAIAALWAAFLEVDPRLEESAASAGVSWPARMLGIVEPLVRPALGLAFVLVVVLALREIDTIVLIESDTVMRRIYTLVHYQRDDQVAALCVLLIAMQAIPFAVYALLLPRRRAA